MMLCHMPPSNGYSEGSSSLHRRLLLLVPFRLEAYAVVRIVFLVGVSDMAIIAVAVIGFLRQLQQRQQGLTQHKPNGCKVSSFSFASCRQAYAPRHILQHLVKLAHGLAVHRSNL